VSITIREIVSVSLATRGAKTAVLAGLIVFAASRPVAAEETINGPSMSGEICMQKVFATPVAKSTQLNCTANDIRLSKATSWSPATCTKGAHFDLTAKFQVDVTASGRFDTGIFFRTDGGPNARGDGVDAAGVCSLSALDPDVLPDPAPVLDLDGDTCGDLDAGTHFVTLMIPDVLCQDSDDDGQLNLPYCTSWHSNQGTACDIDGNDNLVFEQNDQLNFKPDTKSKCVCDDGFEIPIAVEDATITVTKTANYTELPEPGGAVTYKVVIVNESLFESVTLTTIEDDLFGDLLSDVNMWVDANGCASLLEHVLAPGNEVSCEFTADVYEDAGFVHTNVVTAGGIQTGNGNYVWAADDASVTITDEPTKPTVSKSFDGCQKVSVDAVYTVTVANPSQFDELTVDALTDDRFGDILHAHAAVDPVEEVVSTDCAAGTTIEPGAPPYTCSFVGRITDTKCEFTHTNKVTAATLDDDTKSTTESNSAAVAVSVAAVP
jgi:hypothetical protein